MFPFSRAYGPTLFFLVPIATLSSAGDFPVKPDEERHREPHPVGSTLPAPPGQKEAPLRFEDRLEQGTVSAPPDDTPQQHLLAPGGLGAPWVQERWPLPPEPESRSPYESLSPLPRQEGQVSDRQREIDQLERYGESRGFPDDDGFRVEEDASREARWRSWDRFWQRVRAHEHDRWSFHFYGGQNFTDTLAEVLRGETHRHPSGLASVGVVRDGGPFFGLYHDAWWWPAWEVEYTFTRRFEGSPLNEHNIVPLRARWDLPLGARLSRHVEVSLAVSEGVSVADGIPNVEVNGREKSHRVQNFLAFDLILGLPFLGEYARSTNLFFRIHHRSDAYGLYPEDGGSNTLTVGLSFGHRRTQRRW